MIETTIKRLCSLSYDGYFCVNPCSLEYTVGQGKVAPGALIDREAKVITGWEKPEGWVLGSIGLLGKGIRITLDQNNPDQRNVPFEAFSP